MVVLGLWSALGTPPSAALPSATTSAPIARPCSVPALPLPGSAPTSGQPPMVGPAVTALTGGAARHAFSVDGTNLVVQPPRPGDRPSITAHQAECDALAALGDDNAPLSGSAGSGVAVGYARVSVAPGFFPPPSGPPGTDLTPGDVQPTMPASTPYQNRLAWVVVLTHQVVVSCPLETSPPTTAPPRATDDDYQVFLVDARTGRDALVYSESQPGQCGSSVRMAATLIQPREQVSVPWILTSRDPDGYSGTLTASMLPCDGHSDPVLLDENSDTLRVLVERPVGARCGAPRPVQLTLHAATVTSDLPPEVTHAPTGLYTGFPASGGSAVPTTTTPGRTGGRLVPATPQEDGTTIAVNVDDVVTVEPDQNAWKSAVPQLSNPVVSSDPAVLGPLEKPQPLVAEFRAWKPGRAVLSLPASACRSVPAGQSSCWVVHVVVRAR